MSQSSDFSENEAWIKNQKTVRFFKFYESQQNQYALYKPRHPQCHTNKSLNKDLALKKTDKKGFVFWK